MLRHSRILLQTIHHYLFLVSFFFNFLEYTDTPVLNFWWCLPRDSEPLLCSFVTYMQLSFSIIRLFLPTSGRILPALTEKSKVKNCPQWGLNPRPLEHHTNALLTELSKHLVTSLNLWGLYKVMLYSSNDQSAKCEVVHETKLTSVISCPTNTCRAQSVEQ